jgi:flavin-dependent dehydrogenase
MDNVIIMGGSLSGLSTAYHLKNEALISKS